ncbi:hypothetical protein EQH87_16650 [Lactiplantibacillus plantarum]|nr:hypothetical protein EQH87_16650 [Lactiplantibacillus plantarum]
MKVTVCHDSGHITTDQIRAYGLARTNLIRTDSSGRKSTSRFVGVVINEDKNVLLSVPKYYREHQGLKDAQLLLRVFSSYTAHNVQNFTGKLNAVRTNVPLKDFEIV